MAISERTYRNSWFSWRVFHKMKPCNNFDRTGERYVETRQQITVSLDQQRQFSGWKWHYKNPTSCFSWVALSPVMA
ncbi:hypothetical protein T4C_854 [Trichinella pseudospiralis]|uniref:Uncharacterized protein n=1 Tax=Trichinella pseudospiralis TaxID=6337 RepID=A0A0V1K2N5_TRIPS|nr:hypothetical protein T4C_854 [Trichinella pseudospiralis]